MQVTCLLLLSVCINHAYYNPFSQTSAAAQHIREVKRSMLFKFVRWSNVISSTIIRGILLLPAEWSPHITWMFLNSKLMLLHVTKCQWLSDAVLVLSPSILEGLSELDCCRGRILLSQVHKKKRKQTGFRVSNPLMSINFIAYTPALFMSVSRCVQGCWTAKLSSCREKWKNCQFSLEL